MNKKVIVLGADSGYRDKIETTIKSVCAHNRSVKFYVFNDDMPSEWFQLMTKRLEPLSSEIVNVKISSHSLKNYHLPLSHLSYAAFFRYFIPQFVEENRAIYLDSDVIVRGSLDALFSEDLGDFPMAAVEDDLTSDSFNSGVMLIDVDVWRTEGVTEKLFELTNQFHESSFGDQGILNILFQKRWKKLPQKYNFMVGMDTVARNYQIVSWYQDSLVAEKEAEIIHYTGEKPWYGINLNRFRNEWWFYYGLEWSDIVMRKMNFEKGLDSLIDSPIYHTAIFTNTCRMEQLEYLIRELPYIHFSILAPTEFASEIVDLQRYLNVRIFPVYNPMNLIKVLEEIDFYLDINYEAEVDHIIEKVNSLGKPILTFDSTDHTAGKASYICKKDEPEKMVEKIRSLFS
ncbi:glycosyltransferase family 8 protein [Streptococcus mitis]|uniref:Glycosyltransferase family 8 n=1 Tax=Streptococcus mitis SK1080 TaxID=1008453 RepID=F9HNK3_STRMT|nr:glycosyltransferase family 8 protein [Streptococcus mitis]EGP67976.1 glycosyltransferase family 8 [Streptococcus mitis SK1080]